MVRTARVAPFFGMGTMVGLSIYLPLYFEAVRGLCASHSGLALIPLMGGTVVGATVLRARHGTPRALQADALAGRRLGRRDAGSVSPA